jgi:pSer/pThr/pTyr-binding forkhead associated (FHA) protein
MDIQLVVASGKKKGQEIPINGSKFFIGRADDCHLKPRSDLISRYHCVVISEDGYVGVRDFGSKNGTFVNGERVSIEKELKNGDQLTIGQLEFEVKLSVEVGGEKKPKIDSVEAAAARTVERETEAKKKAATQEDDDLDVTDWLLGEEESAQNEETRTVDVNHVEEEEEQPEEQEAKSEKKQRIDKAQNKLGAHKQQSGSSRDAAADMLKNFFKGGR